MVDPVDAEKRAGISNPVKNRVLESCSNIFFTLVSILKAHLIRSVKFNSDKKMALYYKKRSQRHLLYAIETTDRKLLYLLICRMKISS